MIRFVDLGFQIDETTRMFAWWDTVFSGFISHGGEFAWESWEDFSEAIGPEMLERYGGLMRGLMPAEWPGVGGPAD